MVNKSSGRVGVSWHKNINKWTAYISVAGKRIYLGNFKNLEDAISAREKAESNIKRTRIKSQKEKEKRAVEKEQKKQHYKNADMSKLSLDQRKFFMNYLSGMRVLDIADKYGVSHQTAYNRIKEAKNIIDIGAAYSEEEIERKKTYRKKYYQEHKDKAIKYAIEYEKNHPEKAMASIKKNYLKNREKRIERMGEYNKEYYQKNQEKILAKAKKRCESKDAPEA